MDKKTNFNFKKLTSLIVLFVVMLVSAFSLVGCKFTNDDDDSASATYDESGNLRLPVISIDYNPYELNGGARGTSESTGIFSFDLPYYYAGGNLNYNDLSDEIPTLDQANTAYYNTVETVTASDGSTYPHLNNLNVYYKSYAPVYYENKTAEEIYSDFESIFNSGLMLEGNPSNSQIMPSGRYTLKAIETTTNPDGSFTDNYVVGQVFNQDYLISNASTNGIEVAFPDFLMVVDGIEIEVKAMISSVVFDAEGLASVSATFYYRDESGSEMIDGQKYTLAPSSYISSDIVNGRLKVYVNPRLTEGTTNRTIKIKALSKDPTTIDTDNPITRGDSLFSKIITYRAYKLEFNAYSTNSSTTDHAGLIYNTDINSEDNKYYFFDIDETYSENLGKNIVTKLVGYFPEGRVVEVEREIYEDGDYALQAWTTNEHAENSRYLASFTDVEGNSLLGLIPDSMSTPSDLLVYFDELLRKPDNTLSSTEKLIRDSYVKHLFENKTTRSVNGFYTVPVSFANDLYLYYENDTITNTSLSHIFKDSITHNVDKYTSTLRVVSSQPVHGYKFYGNYAKVINFVLSGSIHDGDKFFTSDSSQLNEVVVKVIDSNHTKIMEAEANVDGLLRAKNEGLTLSDELINNVAGNSFTKTINGRNVTIWIRGNEFKVTGLAYDEYVVFNRVGTKIVNGREQDLNYHFYSASMSADIPAGAESIKGLKTLKIGDAGSNIYTDKVNVSIIGTMYEEDTKLEVNIYTTDTTKPNGTTLLGSEDDDSGVSVEIIKTTSSYADKEGYITTNIILSVLVPSNTMLTSYNVEMFKESEKEIYASLSNGYILKVSPFDAATNEYTDTYYYTVAKVPEINAYKTPDGAFYLVKIEEDSELKEKSFVYSHEKDGTIYYVQTDLDYSKNYFYTLAETDGIFSIYKYTRIQDDSTVSYTGEVKYYKDGNEVDASEKDENTTVVYHPQIKYNGVLYYQVIDQNSYPGEIGDGSNVGIVANSYKTDLLFSVEYEDGTVSENQSAYVYYDVTKAKSGNHYFTAPMGRLTSDAETEKELVNWYYGNFNNVTLNYAGNTITSVTVNGNEVIMLGRDILASSDPDVVEFKTVAGKSKIISYCYYYVKAVEGPYTTYVNQSVHTQIGDLFDYELQKFYTESGGTKTYYDIIFSEENHDVMSVLVSASGNYGTILDVAERNLLGQEQPVGALTDFGVARVNNRYEYVYAGMPDSGASLANYLETLGILYSTGYLYDTTKPYVTEDNYSLEYVIDTQFKHSNGDTIKYSNATYEDSTYTITEPTGFRENESCQIGDDLLGGIKTFDEGSYTLIQIAYDNADGLYVKRTSLININGTYYNENDIKSVKLNKFVRAVVDPSSGATTTKTFYCTDDYISYISSIDSETASLTDINHYNNFMAYENDETTVTSVVYVYNTNGAESIDITNTNGVVIKNFTTHGGATYTNMMGKWDIDGTDTYFPITHLSFSTKYGYKYFVGENKREALKDENGNFVDNEGNIVTEENAVYVENIVKADNDPSTDGIQGTLLSVETEIVKYPAYDYILKRQFTIQNNDGTTTFGYLLGKYVMSSDDEPIIYPAFSDLIKTNQQSSTNINDENTKFYAIDYTTVKNVIEGFPGMKLLDGSPYPNPIYTLQIRHKANESAGIKVVLDVNSSYYVELLASLIKPKEESNIVRDFTTTTFKDTLINLQQNNYIDKMYQILDRNTLNPVYTYYYDGSEYKAYYTDSEGNMLPLTVQEVGINDNDPYLYYARSKNSKGIYTEKVYMLNEVTNKYYPVEYEDDVILWKTTTSKIEDVPYYDIHSYEQGLDGFIYFNSGKIDSANSLCTGLEGIKPGSTVNTNEGFDYSEVVIGGTTSAYRTSYDWINSTDNELVGYFEDKMIPIANTLNSDDTYFLIGKESAVIVASPVVNLDVDDLGASYIYRFKEWIIYSRYNSELIYYDQGLTESIVDRYNAILRFTAREAGYYVFLPVYERVYSIGLGAMVEYGAVNQGGSIQVKYKDGSAVDINPEDDRLLEGDTLYFTDYFETTEDGESGFFYDQISAVPYLYFTGKFTASGEPIFKEDFNDSFNIINFRNNYYKVVCNDGYINLEHVPVLDKNSFTDTTEETAPEGIIIATQESVLYSFVYPTVNVDGKIETKNYSHYYLKELNGSTFTDLLGFVYSTTYFFDTLNRTENSSGTNTPVVYKEVNYDNRQVKEFYAIDNHSLNLRNTTSAGFNKVAEATSYYDFLSSNTVHFATSFDRKFIPIKTYSGNYFDGYKTESSLNLISDEVKYKDSNTIANGNNTTYNEEAIIGYLNYKTSYFDRDTEIVLTATPDEGYVLAGWYQANYDQTIGSFVIDKNIYAERFEYSDRIIPAYYNEFNAEYYYVTEYSETVAGWKVYYTDAAKTIKATVPSSMLSSVRGLFIDINQGKSATKNYIEIYQSGTGGYYYDANFTDPVNLTYTDKDGFTTTYTVVELPYVDAIRYVTSNKDANGSYIKTESDIYTLSNQSVYYYNGSFYRTKSNGNISITGNQVTIHKLHSNVRFIAVFKEIYDAYIFSEMESESGVKVDAVYYYNSEQALVNPTNKGVDNIRFNAYGDMVTSIDQNISENVSVDDKIKTLYYGTKSTTSGEQKLEFTISFAKDKFTYAAGDQRDKYIISDEASNILWANSGFSIAKELNGHNKATSTYRLTNGIEAGLEDNTKLNMQDFFFAENTVTYIVVRVENGFELTMHSLGMNPDYELTPILSPTDDYVRQNSSLGADNEDFSQYMFYIFKVEYNRDPENENASLIAHQSRGDSMLFDLLSGKRYDFYSKYYELVDSLGNTVLCTKGITLDDPSARNYSFIIETDPRNNQEIFFFTRSYIEKVLEGLTNKNGTPFYKTSEDLKAYVDLFMNKQNALKGFVSLIEAYEYLSDICYKNNRLYILGARLTQEYFNNYLLVEDKTNAYLYTDSDYSGSGLSFTNGSYYNNDTNLIVENYSILNRYYYGAYKLFSTELHNQLAHVYNNDERTFYELLYNYYIPYLIENNVLDEIIIGLPNNFNKFVRDDMKDESMYKEISKEIYTGIFYYSLALYGNTFTSKEFKTQVLPQIIKYVTNNISTKTINISYTYLKNATIVEEITETSNVKIVDFMNDKGVSIKSIPTATYEILFNTLLKIDKIIFTSDVNSGILDNYFEFLKSKGKISTLLFNDSSRINGTDTYYSFLKKLYYGFNTGDITKALVGNLNSVDELFINSTGLQGIVTFTDSSLDLGIDAGGNDIIKNIKQVNNYYMHSGPFYSVATNFINLSTIEIYRFNIETVTLEGYAEDGSPIQSYTHQLSDTIRTAAGTQGYTYIGSGEEYDELYEYFSKGIESGNATKFSKKFILSNESNYVRNSNKTRYEEIIFAKDTLIAFEGVTEVNDGYMFVGWYEQKFDSDAPVYRLDAEGNYVLNARGEKIIESYGVWSELKLVSNDLQYPYVTVSDADTMIVGLFKRTVEFSYSYNPDEFNVELSRSTDDLGNDVKFDESNGMVTISGTFAFDTVLDLTVTPVGGYALSNITSKVNDGDSNAFTFKSFKRAFDLVWFELDNYTISEFDNSENEIFNKTAQNMFKFSLYENVKFTNLAEKNSADKIALSITAKEIQLIYIEIEGDLHQVIKTGPTTSIYQNAFTFVVYGINDAGEVKIYNVIDSNSLNDTYAQSDASGLIPYVKYTSEKSMLTMYVEKGYTENLYITTLKRTSGAEDKSIKLWFVNGYSTETMAVDPFELNGDLHIDVNDEEKLNAVDNYLGEDISATAREYSVYNHFNIKMLYSGAHEYLNNITYFDLKENNNTYYLYGRIIDNKTVEVDHTFVDSFESLNSTDYEAGSYDETKDVHKFFDNNLALTTLVYNGTYYKTAASEPISGSGVYTVKSYASFIFGNETKIDLKLENEFIEHNGNIYMFAGWYEKVTDGGNIKLHYLSSDLSFATYSVKSVTLEARYILMDKIETVVNGHGELLIESNSLENRITSGLLYPLGHENEDSEQTVVFDAYSSYAGSPYAMHNSTIIVNAIPADGYIAKQIEIAKVTKTTSSESQETYKKYINKFFSDIDGKFTINYKSDITYKVDEETNEHAKIIATFEKGNKLTIEQILYSAYQSAIDSLNTGDKYIDSPLITIYYNPLSNDPDDDTDSDGDSVSDLQKYEIIGQTFTLPEGLKLKIEFTGDNTLFTLVGIYNSGTIISSTNETGKLEYKDSAYLTLAGDTKLEARLVESISVNILARLTDGSALTSYNFKYSYFNFKNSETVTGEFNKTSELLILPAGTVINVKDITEIPETSIFSQLGYRYVKTNSFDAVSCLPKEIVVKGKTIETSIIGDNSFKVDGQVYNNLVSLYAKVTKLTLTKEIIYHETDEEKSDNKLFNSYLDYTVEYFDKYGDEKSISLGEAQQIYIEIQNGSNITIKPNISAEISDRYSATGLTFDYKDESFEDYNFDSVITDSLTLENVNNNGTVIVEFRALNKIVISLESDNAPVVSDDNVQAEVTYTSSTQEKSLVIGDPTAGIVYTSSIQIYADDKSTVTLKAIENEFVKFIGWFDNSEQVSSDAEYSFTSTKSVTMVAKFVRIAEITLETHVDNVLYEGDKNLKLTLTGNSFGYDEASSSYKYIVSTHTFTPASGDTYQMQALKDMFISSSHKAGYTFTGFTVISADGSEDNIELYNGYDYTALVNLPAGAHTIVANYKTERTISYNTLFVSPSETSKPNYKINGSLITYNYDLVQNKVIDETLTIDAEAYYEDYQLAAINVYTYNKDGNKISRLLDSSEINLVDYEDVFSGENVVVEAIYAKTVTIKIRFALNDSDYKSVIEKLIDNSQNLMHRTITNAYTGSIVDERVITTDLSEIVGNSVIFSFTTLYGNEVELNFVESLESITNGDLLLDGLYIFDTEKMSIATSNATIRNVDELENMWDSDNNGEPETNVTNYNFVCDRDQEWVLKYANEPETYTVTTNISASVITTTVSDNATVVHVLDFNTLTKVKNKNGTYTVTYASNGTNYTKQVAFVGYIQEIKNDLRPSNFVMLSRNIDYSYALSGVLNVEAVFVEVTPATIVLSNKYSSSMNSSMLSSLIDIHSNDSTNSSALSPIISSNRITFNLLSEIVNNNPNNPYTARLKAYSSYINATEFDGTLQSVKDYYYDTNSTEITFDNTSFTSSSILRANDKKVKVSIEITNTNETLTDAVESKTPELSHSFSLARPRTFAAAASIEDVILSDTTDESFTQELSPDKTILIIENTGDDFESFTITFVLDSSEEIKYIFFEESNYIVISDYLTEAEIALLQTINVTRQSNKKITIEDASSYIKINLSTNAVNYSLIATVINAHTQESESITVTSDALGSIEDFARIVDKLTLSLQVIDSSILDIQKFECYEVIFTNDEGEEVTLEYTSRNLDILISELVINNTISELSIYAKFENSYQLALEEQETNKDGTIDIVESTEVLNKVTATIATDQNKYISNIELAIVNDDNTVGEYISIMNGFDVDDTLLNLDKIYGSIVERVYTSADSNGKVLLNSLKLEFDLESNYIIRVTISDYYTLVVIPEVNDEEKNDDSHNFTITKEDMTNIGEEDSPIFVLTYDNINALHEDSNSCNCITDTSLVNKDSIGLFYNNEKLNDEILDDYDNIIKEASRIIPQTVINVYHRFILLEGIKVEAKLESEYNLNASYEGINVNYTNIDDSSKNVTYTNANFDKLPAPYTYPIGIEFKNEDAVHSITGISVNHKVSLSTHDANSYYDFIGWHYMVGEELVLISPNENISLTKKFFKDLESNAAEKVDGNYKLVAIYKEAYRTIEVKPDYPSQSFNVSLNGIADNITAEYELKHIDVKNITETLYSIAFNFKERESGERTLKVYYPIKAIEDLRKLNIELVTDSSQDEYYKEVSYSNDFENNTYYEKKVVSITTDGYNYNYYRFKNFYENQNKLTSRDYLNATTIDLTYNNRTIIASAVRLYKVEFMTNFVDNNGDIKLNLNAYKKDESGNVIKVNVETKDTDPNVLGFNSNTIEYFFEQGTIVEVTVDYQAYSASSEYSDNPYNTLVYTNRDLISLSDIYSKLDEIKTSEHVNLNDSVNSYLNRYYTAFKDFWTTYYSGYTPVNQLDAINPTDQTNSNVNEFSFSANQNYYFLADFKDAFGDIRYYVNSTLTATTGSSLNISGDKIDSGLVTKNQNDDNKTFVFALVQPNNDVKTTVTEYVTSYPVTGYIEGVNQNLTDNSFSYVSKNTSTSSTIGEQKYIKLHIETALNRTKMPDLTETTDDDYAVENWEIFEDGKQPEIKVNVNGSFIDIDSYNKIKYGDSIKIFAEELEGYFFKGFVNIANTITQTIKAASYTQANISNTIKSLRAISEIKGNYGYLGKSTPSDTSYFTLEFTANGDYENIVALYERKTYLITVNKLKYDVERHELTENTTENQVKSAKIKGSLIALEGKSLILSSLSYNYTQFYGWTKVSGLYSSQNTKVFANAGELIDFDKLGKEIYAYMNRDVAAASAEVSIFDTPITSSDDQNNNNQWDDVEKYIRIAKYYEEILSAKISEYNDTSDRDLKHNIMDQMSSVYRTYLQVLDMNILSGTNDNQLRPYFDHLNKVTGTDVTGDLEEYLRSTLSSYAYNNLYITEIHGDAELNAYYAPMQYTITIDLYDIISGYNYDTNTSDPYISYSEEFIEYVKAHGTENHICCGWCENYLDDRGNWCNPASKYNNGGTIYLGDTEYTFDIYPKIEKDDTHIYTFVDITGTLISSGFEYVKDGEFCDFIHLVPTKVLASTINYEKSYESGFLLMESGGKTFPVITNLKQVDYNYKGTDTKHYAINNYQEAMEDPKYGLTIVPFFEVQIEGTSETQKTSPYNDFKANRNLSNVYDFIVRDGNVYSFRSDLFTIRIKGLENTVINATQINTSNGLKFNSSTKTLTYKLTISAVEYIGFPTIQLIMNDLRNEDDESLPIKYYLFDLNGYIPGDGEPSNDDQTLNIIRGFHNMMRFDTEDPSSGVGNLDVNLSLYYIYTSKPVEVQIDYTNLYIGHEDVYKQGISVGSVILTGKNKNEYTEGLLTTVSLDKSGYLRKRLTKNDKVYLLNSMGYDVDKGNLAMYEKYLSYDDILKYNVYVIKQARYILDILETIAANTTQGSDDNVTANTYIGYIYSFGKGDTKYYASDTKYVFPRFSSDGYSSGSLIQFINRFKHIHGETISLSLGSDGLLEFAEINILELFKSNVNYNYYNNAFSYGDMIVSTVTLNQLYQYQNNHGNSKNWCYNIAIGEKAPYTADQGYMYLDWAKLSYGADISNGTLTTSCETPPNSESGEEDQSDAVVPISSDKDRHNRIAGIFNGYKRYAGSFMARFSSAMLAASDEFNGDDLNIKSILKIDKAKDKRLKTAASEWNPEPMKNKVISFGVAILDIVVTVVSSVYSGGTGALAWGALKKTLLKAMAKAAIKATVTDFVLDCVDGYIRSMYLDGKDIFNEIGKMLKA